MAKRIRVTVWNEFLHEKQDEAVRRVYPEGIHEAVATPLRECKDMEVRTATLGEPEHGLTQEVLNNTDVLTWWGHMGHHLVQDEIVQRVQARVLNGMGLIVLHSGHLSKIFRALMGTTCCLKWRGDGEKERLWNIEPGHPITAGLGDYFELPRTEMYGERFEIPAPDKLIFISWFEGGEVFRSGCCWERGHGRIFYFRPGHETYPIYHDRNVHKVLVNAVRWAQARVNIDTSPCPNVPERIEKPAR